MNNEIYKLTKIVKESPNWFDNFTEIEELCKKSGLSEKWDSYNKDEIDVNEIIEVLNDIEEAMGIRLLDELELDFKNTGFIETDPMMEIIEIMGHKYMLNNRELEDDTFSWCWELFDTEKENGVSMGGTGLKLTRIYEEYKNSDFLYVKGFKIEEMDICKKCDRNKECRASKIRLCG